MTVSLTSILRTFFSNPVFIFLEEPVSVQSTIGNSVVSFKSKHGTYILNYFSCIFISTFFLYGLLIDQFISSSY